MHQLFLIYRWLLHNPFVETVNCFFWGIIDMLNRAFDTFFGWNKAPDWLNGWQEDQFCFYPPVTYPLPDNPRSANPPFSWLDARGVYTGCVVFRYLPFESVQALLPPGVFLNPALKNPEGHYPVVYLFGFQQDLRQSWMITRGIDYLEFCLGVLGVQLQDTEGRLYTGPFLYLPRLYLNRPYPTLLGIICCYAKRWARIATTNFSWTISTLFRGREILSANFQPAGPIGKPADFPEFQKWIDLLDAPTANHFDNKDYVFLDYDWGWKYALIQPMRAQVNVSQAMPGLPAGITDYTPLDGDAIGAFRVTLPFEWVPPFRRADLKCVPHRMTGLSPSTPAPRAKSASTT